MLKIKSLGISASAALIEIFSKNRSNVGPPNSRGPTGEPFEHDSGQLLSEAVFPYRLGMDYNRM